MPHQNNVLRLASILLLTTPLKQKAKLDVDVFGYCAFEKIAEVWQSFGRFSRISGSKRSITVFKVLLHLVILLLVAVY